MAASAGCLPASRELPPLYQPRIARERCCLQQLLDDELQETVNVVFVVEKMQGDAQAADARRVPLRNQNFPVQEPLQKRRVAPWTLAEREGHDARARRMLG